MDFFVASPTTTWTCSDVCTAFPLPWDQEVSPLLSVPFSLETVWCSPEVWSTASTPMPTSYTAAARLPPTYSCSSPWATHLPTTYLPWSSHSRGYQPVKARLRPWYKLVLPVGCNPQPTCWVQSPATNAISVLLWCAYHLLRLLWSCQRVPTSTSWSYLLGAIPSHLHLPLQPCWRSSVPPPGIPPPPTRCCHNLPSPTLLFNVSSAQVYSLHFWESIQAPLPKSSLPGVCATKWCF